MKEDLISLVISIYNVEQYLDECIRSIINQTYKNIEIIAIDDGSTDSSLKIIKKYKEIDNRIKIISWENKGQGACRNEGIKIARGKYIMFIDSDDYIDKNTVEVLVNCINKNTSEIVLYNGRAFDDFGDDIKFHKQSYFHIYKKFNSNKYDKVDNIKDIITYVQPCMKIYVTNFIQDNDIFFTEGKYGEDVEFWYKCCALSKNIGYIDFNGYYRRYRPNSIMTGGSIRNISDRIESFEILRGIVSLVNEKDKKIFEQTLGEYALGIYFKICNKEGDEFKKLYQLFKENDGMKIINLAKLKPKSLLKKNIIRATINIKMLLN